MLALLGPLGGRTVLPASWVLHPREPPPHLDKLLVVVAVVALLGWQGQQLQAL